ncbi:hypothetical protein OY671_009732, partial [Metschnikowia pulcherrima]
CAPAQGGEEGREGLHHRPRVGADLSGDLPGRRCRHAERFAGRCHRCVRQGGQARDHHRCRRHRERRARGRPGFRRKVQPGARRSERLQCGPHGGRAHGRADAGLCAEGRPCRYRRGQAQAGDFARRGRSGSDPVRRQHDRPHRSSRRQGGPCRRRDPAGRGLHREGRSLRQHRGPGADGQPRRVPAGRCARRSGD